MSFYLLLLRLGLIRFSRVVRVWVSVRVSIRFSFSNREGCGKVSHRVIGMIGIVRWVANV